MRINAQVQVNLQNNTNACVPGSVVTQDLADGAVTLEKTTHKLHYFTITLPIPEPVHTDVVTGIGLGYTPTTTYSAALAVCPCDVAYLRRIDISVTDNTGPAGTNAVTLNFKRSSSGPYFLSAPAGLYIQANSADLTNSYDFAPNDPTQLYNKGDKIFVDIINVSPDARGLTVNFTFTNQLTNL